MGLMLTCSLHGSCSSSEKLDIEQQGLFWFFWALLMWLSIFSTWIRSSQLEQPIAHMLAKSSLIFSSLSWEWGNESIRLSFAAPAYWDSSRLWWPMNCWREDDACLCTSTSCKAQCLSYRINWISKMWAHGINFLTWRKENRNIAGNKQSKKIQTKPWLLQFTLLIWPDPS